MSFVINATEALKNMHEFILKITKGREDFSDYHASAGIKKTVDLYFAKLEEHYPYQNRLPAKPAKAVVKKAAPAKATKTIKAVTPKAVKPAKEKKARTAKAIVTKAASNAEMVEHIPSDIALVKKYIGINGKVKTFDQILAIWRAFEKATIERKVTKDSPYRIAINTMKASLQSALVKAETVGQLKLTIEEDKLKDYRKIAESVEKSASVSMMLEFINISGKERMEERAIKLSKRMSKALSSGVLDKDCYKDEVQSALVYIEAYLEHETDRIEMKDNALSGLGSLSVLGCACTGGLNGANRIQNAVILKLIQEKVKNLEASELNRAFKDTVAPSICKLIARKLIQAGQLTMKILRNPAQASPGLAGFPPIAHNYEADIMDMRIRNAARKQINIGGTLGSVEDAVHFNTSVPNDAKIMSAQELVQMKFKTIGLTGKYKDLIGDPEPAFSAMIFGKPKEGKSTVAIDMAKELTRLGKVLYCAYEEGHGGTLQDKVIRNKADVPGLDFANKLPNDLSNYKFVFIDSVSDAGLDEAAFKALIKANKPNTSIIGIFHATKDGKFRGGQTFAHDVDVLIRVESGVAYAQGRYAPPSDLKF